MTREAATDDIIDCLKHILMADFNKFALNTYFCIKKNPVKNKKILKQISKIKTDN